MSRRTYDEAVISPRRPVLAVALALTVAGCSGGGAGDVRVATVGRSTVAEVVEAPATVTARASATVVAPADGAVARLRVREGQRVRAGQVLLRVESPDARRRLRQAKKADAQAARAGTPVSAPVSLAGAAAGRRQAGRAFDRARAAARGLPAGPARAQALSALRVSQAQYAAARASADGRGPPARRRHRQPVRRGVRARPRRSGCRPGPRSTPPSARSTRSTVRAPIAGTVSLPPPPATAPAAPARRLLAQLPDSLRGQAGDLLGRRRSGAGSVDAALAEGAPVTSGQPLLTVTDVSALSLTAEVDETDVLLVQAGVAAEVELDAVPGATYQAAVTSVDPTPATSSRRRRDLRRAALARPRHRARTAVPPRRRGPA